MSAGDSSRPGASPDWAGMVERGSERMASGDASLVFSSLVFEVRAGGRGHLAFTAELDVAKVIADVAVERLGERVAVVWNGAGESVYRAGAPAGEVAS